MTVITIIENVKVRKEAQHPPSLLTADLWPSRKNLYFSSLVKTGSCRFYSGNRINQLQFFLVCAANRTKLLVKSICKTAPKSLSWSLICSPGFEYPPWLALSICQSGWREIQNAFTIFICWVPQGPRIRILVLLCRRYSLILVKSVMRAILSCCFQFLLWQLPFLLVFFFFCIKADEKVYL